MATTTDALTATTTDAPVNNQPQNYDRCSDGSIRPASTGGRHLPGEVGETELRGVGAPPARPSRVDFWPAAWGACSSLQSLAFWISHFAQALLFQHGETTSS